MNALTSALFLLLLLGVARWGRRRENSWLSRDGTRFIARARVMDPRGGRPGPWMHVRGGVGPASVVIQPGFTGSRHVAGAYVHVSRLGDDRHGAVLYALRGDGTIALRVRGCDGLVRALDSIAAQSS